MRTVKLFALLMLMVAAHGAAAAGIYKIIGPDGKPVFTDKPPSNPATPVEVIKAAPVEALPADNASAPTTVDAQDSAGGETDLELLGTSAKRARHARQAKRAERVDTAAAASTDGANTASPAMEKAVIGVLGLEDLMGQTVELCMRTLPTSFGKYADAADAWRARNGAILTRAHAVLEQQLPAPRTVEAALNLRNHNSLAPVADSNLGARIKWCDQSVASLERGEMDPKDRPALAGPLLGGG